MSAETNATGEPISREEYERTQGLILLHAGMIRALPLGAFLRAIEVSDTLAPIFDPTAYMKGATAMHQVGRLARALLTVKQIADEIASEADTQRSWRPE